MPSQASGTGSDAGESGSSQETAGLEDLLSRWAERVRTMLPVQPSTAALGLIVVLEGVLLAFGAKLKPFWYDELLTVHFGSIRPFAAMIEAYRGGIDLMTVPYMSIMNAVLRLPGDPHVVARAPSIAGYLMALAGLFLFVRRGFGGTAGLMAILLLANSPFRQMAIEARPYTLLTGLLAVAVACWQRAGSTRIALPLLWVTFTLATTMHYFGAFALALLAWAEAAYWLETRKARWSVWLLVPFAGAAVAWSAPFLLATRQAYKGPPAARNYMEALTTYETYLRLDQNIVAAVLVAATAVFAAAAYRLRKHRTGTGGAGGFGFAETAMSFGLVLYAAGVCASLWLIRLQYMPRYGWPSALGLAAVAALLVSSAADRRLPRLIAFSLTLAFLAQSGVGVQKAAGASWARDQPSRKATPGLLQAARAYPEQPIVIGDNLAALELFYYTSHGLSPRMVVLGSSQPIPALGRNVGMQRSISAVTERRLARVTNLRLAEVDEFLAANPDFLLYSTRHGLEWPPRHLLARGYRMQALALDHGGVTIYLVTRPASPGGPQR